ncbi:MAG: YihY/virulence factor BrkB family protein [Actinomycetota bacterium]|nr:YihY/virulence factor BrkB family protein [Actinomycetota bacterium]
MAPRLVTQAKLQIERARVRWPWFDIGMTTGKRFSEDDGGFYAAGLSYYIFFSIFPLLLFATSILGYLALDESTQTRIFKDGVKAVPLLEDALSPDGFKTIEDNRQGLAVTGFVLALYSGSGAIVALEHALNVFNKVVQEPNFLKKRLRSLLLLAVLGAGAILSVAATSVAGYVTGPLGGIGGIIASIGGYALGVASSVAIFATAFRILPATSTSWREVLPGAVAGALVFEVLKVIGAELMSGGGEGRNATFGLFAAAAGLLVASYLVSQIILLAAELNRVLAERRITRESTSGSR